VYGSLQHRRWRLRVHRAREREWHRIAQQLAWGYTGVRGRWSHFAPHVPHRHSDCPELVVIGWGAASAGHGSSISRVGCGPSKAFIQFMRSNYSQYNVHVLRVNEHRTSKICTNCWHCGHSDYTFTKTRNGKRTQTSTFMLQVCQNPTCKLVVDRDVSAAIAIMARLLGMLVPAAPQWLLAAMEHGRGRPD
jgi:hypothetical protein